MHVSPEHHDSGDHTHAECSHAPEVSANESLEHADDAHVANHGVLDHSSDDHPCGSEFQTTHGSLATEPCSGVSHENELSRDHFLGHPSGDGFAPQTTPFTCGVMAQKMILDAFGICDSRSHSAFSETSLAYDGWSHGWLTDHGMSSKHLGSILRLHGVETHRGHSPESLLKDLEAGHQVIVPVDSHVLWNHDWAHPHGQSHRPSPDHVVVLKGIRVDAHGHSHVVVNDPGRQHGDGNEYPIEHFRAAIDTKHLDYVATDAAPPGWSAPCNHLPHSESASSQHSQASDECTTFEQVVDQLSGEERNAFFRRI
jgi:hypothetical protein